MILRFFLILGLVGLATGREGWQYYNYDLFCSRYYPYSSVHISNLDFATPTYLSGSVRYGGCANIVGDTHLEVVLLEGTTLRVVSHRGEELYRKTYSQLGTVVMDDPDKDGYAELIVGAATGTTLYVEVLDFTDAGGELSCSVAATFLVGSNTSLFRVQPRCIHDFDYDGKPNLILTIGEGKNFKPRYLKVYDYPSGELVFERDIKQDSFGSISGDYPSILLSGGSPYTPKTLSCIDTDGYVLGYDRDGDISWKRYTGTWWIRSMLINLDNEGLEEMVLLCGPPSSGLYILDSYTGFQKKTKEGKDLFILPEGYSYLSGAALDINKDKKYEIAVGGTDGSLKLYDYELNLITVATLTGSVFIHAVNDINGDTFPELIVSANDKVYIMNSLFNVLSSVTVASTVTEVMVSDLNCDQKIDLLVAFADKTAIFANQGMPPPIVADIDDSATQTQTQYSPVYDYVWPGNTNNDTIVDRFDILPLILHWGSVGQGRAVEEPYKWCAQSVVKWNDVAAAHSDTNGDGKVDEKDILAIAVNWGKQIDKPHPKYAPAKVNDLQAFIKENHTKIDYLKHMFKCLIDSMPNEANVKMALIDLIELYYAQTLPNQTKLHQAYPNPGQDAIWLPFELSEPAHVRIKIYNISGQLVRTIDLGHLPAGRFLCNSGGAHRDNSNLVSQSMYGTKYFAAYWDMRGNGGVELPSGVYFYQLLVTTKNKTHSYVKRAVIIR